MFNIGRQGGKVRHTPHFPTITVHNTRAGFFEPDAFARVCAELPEYLRPLATVGYLLGWRKGELLELERPQVDLEHGTVRLDPGSTKKGRPDHIPPSRCSCRPRFPITPQIRSHDQDETPQASDDLPEKKSGNGC
jgi:hypothetical protein